MGGLDDELSEGGGCLCGRISLLHADYGALGWALDQGRGRVWVSSEEFGEIAPNAKAG